jgi:CheY-like chemotaxis protein
VCGTAPYEFLELSVSANPRVLVIDDDEIVREVMCDLLRAKGCQVFDSGSPIGVTRTVGEQDIDVVVLDVMMPGLSGDKLAKLLRDNPRMPKLSIVLGEVLNHCVGFYVVEG